MDEGHFWGVMGTLIFWGFIAAIILVPAWMRHQQRMASIRLVSEALAKGAQLDPEITAKLMSPQRDNFGRGFALLFLFLGIGGLCVGLGLGVGSQMFMPRLDESGRAAAGMMLGATITGLSGLGFIGLGALTLWLFRDKQES